MIQIERRNVASFANYEQEIAQYAAIQKNEQGLNIIVLLVVVVMFVLSSAMINIEKGNKLMKKF